LLYETIQNFFASFSPENIQANANLVNENLIPVLISRWTQLSDDNQDIIPLLEALTNIASSMGVTFLQHAKSIWERAYRIIIGVYSGSHLTNQSQSQQKNIHIQEDLQKDFVIASLDVMSGIAEGLKHYVLFLIRRFLHTSVL
jgi:transportin-1